MRRAALLAAIPVLAAVPTAVAAPVLQRPPAAAVRPPAFTSCRALVHYARSHFAVTRGVPSTPIVPVAQPAIATATPVAPAASAGAAHADGGSAAPSSTFSTTNNQEEGVDEPDLVKTDGSTIYTVSGDTLFAVAVADGKPRIAGSLDLGSSGSGAQLFLNGNRLLVISQAAPAVIRPLPGIAFGRRSPPRPTTATRANDADRGGRPQPSAPKVTQTLTVDGRFVDARQNGSTARLVIASAPQGIVDPQSRSEAGGWVPTRVFHDLRTGSGSTRPVTSCASIRRPVQFSGLGMLAIVTVDFDKGLGLAHSERCSPTPRWCTARREAVRRDPEVARSGRAARPRARRAGDGDRSLRRRRSRQHAARRERRGARLPPQPVSRSPSTAATCGWRPPAGRSGGASSPRRRSARAP